MKKKKRWIALLMAAAMLTETLGSTALAASSTGAGQDGTVQTSESGSGAVFRKLKENAAVSTWTQAAAFLGKLLGYTGQEAANLDFSVYSGKIKGISAADDSLYLAILMEQGYLDGMSLPDSADEKISDEDWEMLLQRIYPQIIRDAKEAETLTSGQSAENVLVTAADTVLSGIDADRISIVDGDGARLSKVTAKSASFSGSGSITLTDTKLDRLYLAAQKDQEIHLKLDQDTQIPEIMVSGGASVVIEGNGALGVVRVTDAPDALTVRATCSVINEFERRRGSGKTGYGADGD